MAQVPLAEGTDLAFEWSYDPTLNPVTSSPTLTEQNLAHFLLQNRGNINWREGRFAPEVSKYLGRPGVISPDIHPDLANALRTGDVKALLRMYRERVPEVLSGRYRETFDPDVLTPAGHKRNVAVATRKELYPPEALTAEMESEAHDFTRVLRQQGRGGTQGDISHQKGIIRDYLGFLSQQGGGLDDVGAPKSITAFEAARRSAGLGKIDSKQLSALRQFTQWRRLREIDPENVFNLRGGGLAASLGKGGIPELEKTIKELVKLESLGHKLTPGQAAKLRQAQDLYVLAAGKVGLPVAPDVRAQRLAKGYGTAREAPVAGEPLDPKTPLVGNVHWGTEGGFTQFLKQRYPTTTTADEHMRAASNVLHQIANQTGKNIKNLRASDLTVSAVNRWIVDRVTGRSGTAISGGALNKSVQALKNFTEYLKTRGVLPESYSLDDIYSIGERAAKKVQPDLTPQMVQAIREKFVAKAARPVEREVREIAYDVAVETAKRGAEVHSIKVKDLLPDGKLRVVIAKKGGTRTPQTIELLPETAKSLRDFITRHRLQPEDPLIPSPVSLERMKGGKGVPEAWGVTRIREAFSSAAQEAGVSASLHNLRAATVTEAAKQGGLGLGKRVAAHAGEGTTAIYVTSLPQPTAQKLLPVLIEQRMVDEVNALSVGKNKARAAGLTGKPIRRTPPPLPEDLVSKEDIALGITPAMVVEKMKRTVNALIAKRIRKVLPPSLREEMRGSVQDKLTRLRAAYEDPSTLGKQAPLTADEFKRLKIAYAKAIDELRSEAKSRQVKRTMKGT